MVPTLQSGQTNGFFVMGFTEWDTSTAGSREITLSVFRSDDTLLGETILNRTNADRTGFVTQPWLFPIKASSNHAYWVIGATQNSGTTLAMLQSYIGIVRVF